MAEVRAVERELNEEVERLKKENEKLREEINRINQYEPDDGLYRNIFENNASVMILLDYATGEIADANQAACLFYGYNKDEIVGANISKINTLPKYKLQSEMNNAATKRKSKFQFKHRLSSGEIRDVEVKSGPVLIKEKSYLYSIVHDITEKNRAIKLREQSEAKFKQLFNNVSDAVFFFRIEENGIPGKFIEVNDLACTRLGYSYEELLTMSPVDIDVHNIDEMFILVNDFWENGKISFETIHVTKDGRKIPVEINNKAFDWMGEKAVLSVARDITRRKQHERELKESLEKQKKLMAFLPDAVLVVHNGRIEFVNEYGVNLLGYKNLSEIKGRKYIDIIHPDYHERAKNRMNYLKRENDSLPLVEEKHIKKNGQTVDIETTAVGIPYEGKYAFLIVGRDVSERKRFKRELEEKKEMERLRKEFFSNISHELKTPLNVLLGAIQVLGISGREDEEPVSRTKLDKYLRTMKQNCYRLLRLVNNVLDLSKFDSGYLKANFQNYNVVNIVEEITLSVADYIENMGLELIFDTDTEEKIMAIDADKIERVILNLLSNAIKFTSPNDKIIVSVADRGDCVAISVKDTGIGIPEDKLKFIFERFVQVDKTLTRNHEGSGIGLALVKSLVAMHEGDISVSSKIGEGSEFVVELPVKPQREEKFIESLPYQSKIERISIEFSDIYK